MPGGVRVDVRNQMLLANRTGKGRDCKIAIVDTCRLSDDGRHEGKWRYGHRGGRLDSLELEQKHLN